MPTILVVTLAVLAGIYIVMIFVPPRDDPFMKLVDWFERRKNRR